LNKKTIEISIKNDQIIIKLPSTNHFLFLDDAQILELINRKIISFINFRMGERPIFVKEVVKSKSSINLKFSRIGLANEFKMDYIDKPLRLKEYLTSPIFYEIDDVYSFININLLSRIGRGLGQSFAGAEFNKKIYEWVSADKSLKENKNKLSNLLEQEGFKFIEVNGIKKFLFQEILGFFNIQTTLKTWFSKIETEIEHFDTYEYETDILYLKSLKELESLHSKYSSNWKEIQRRIRFIGILRDKAYFLTNHIDFSTLNNGLGYISSLFEQYMTGILSTLNNVRLLYNLIKKGKLKNKRLNFINLYKDYLKAKGKPFRPYWFNDDIIGESYPYTVTRFIRNKIVHPEIQYISFNSFLYKDLMPCLTVEVDLTNMTNIENEDPFLKKEILEIKNWLKNNEYVPIIKYFKSELKNIKKQIGTGNNSSLLLEKKKEIEKQIDTCKIPFDKDFYFHPKQSIPFHGLSYKFLIKKTSKNNIILKKMIITDNFPKYFEMGWYILTRMSKTFIKELE